MDKNNEKNDKFYRKVAFLTYTESVKFRSYVLSLSIYIMILSSTSLYALLKEFSIACGFKYDAVFRVFSQ